MRKRIFNCDVDALTMEETIQRIDEFILSGKPHQHVVLNVNKVLKANIDEKLSRTINACDLINCDGMPLVWASRLLGQHLPERVAGIDLFLDLVARAADKGWKVYFLGAREDVVQEIVEIFGKQYPKLQIAGYRNGYWTPEEEKNLVMSIQKTEPDILFVALGSPQKENFLNLYQASMNIPFAMGVGGSFDVVSGLTKRAPVWMQNSGLEWFHRFLQEPRRMFRRYFIEGSGFITLFIQEFCSFRLQKLRQIIRKDS